MVFAFAPDAPRTESAAPPRDRAAIVSRCSDAAFVCTVALRDAKRLRTRLETYRRNLRRPDLLEHPRRPEALASYETFVCRYQGSLLEAVDAVYRGNWTWLDLTPEERAGANPEAIDVAACWMIDAAQPHIFTAFFDPGHRLVTSVLGAGVVIADEVGFIDGLDHCAPNVYPHGVRAAIESGHLRGQVRRTDAGERQSIAAQAPFAVPGLWDIVPPQPHYLEDSEHDR